MPTLHIKTVVEERFQDYKLPSMYLAFPNCTFKCERECGKRVCQNSTLSKMPTVTVDIDDVIRRYLKNHITSAIVLAGLEPLDSFDEVFEFIRILRENYVCEDPVVIYTGYNRNEITEIEDELSIFKNIIVKFGRYVPGQAKHYDAVLGVDLASNNQYAEVISK